MPRSLTSPSSSTWRCRTSIRRALLWGLAVVEKITVSADVLRDQSKLLKPVRDAVVAKALANLPEPIRILLQGAAGDVTAGLAQLSGPWSATSTAVDVTHHDPPQPTTVPTVETAIPETVPVSVTAIAPVGCENKILFAQVSTFQNVMMPDYVRLFLDPPPHCLSPVPRQRTATTDRS